MQLPLRTGPHPAVTEHHARLLQDAHPSGFLPIRSLDESYRLMHRRPRKHHFGATPCMDLPSNEAIPAIALHLHAYFLRLPAKQLLFNYCPQMPTYEADTCMQNTASITAQYG